MTRLDTHNSGNISSNHSPNPHVFEAAMVRWMGSDCALLMQLALRAHSNSSSLLYLYLNRTTDLIRLLKLITPTKSARHIKYTRQVMRNPTISLMILLQRIIIPTIPTLSPLWPRILARVRLFPLPLTAIQLRHRRHLSFQE